MAGRDHKKAQALVDEAYALVGEKGLRTCIMNIGRSECVQALNALHEAKWWVKQLTDAFANPFAVQIPLLCKLLDKLVPNPAATHTEKDEVDTFIISYEKPPDAPIS